MAQKGLLLIADITGYTMAQTMARIMMPLIRSKLVRDRRASKAALERLVAEDVVRQSG